MKFVSLFLLFSVVFFSSNCSVQSSQFKAVKQFFHNSEEDFSANAWQANFLEHKTILYAVSVNDLIVFSNGRGDEIVFDGWSIKGLKGMGLRVAGIKIEDVNKSRVFKIGSHSLATHTCEKWSESRNQSQIRFLQTCNGGIAYENTILIDDNGNISLIRQIVDDKYTALTLIKLE